MYYVYRSPTKLEKWWRVCEGDPSSSHWPWSGMRSLNEKSSARMKDSCSTNQSSTWKATVLNYEKKKKIKRRHCWAPTEVTGSFCQLCESVWRDRTRAGAAMAWWCICDGLRSKQTLFWVSTCFSWERQSPTRTPLSWLIHNAWWEKTTLL